MPQPRPDHDAAPAHRAATRDGPGRGRGDPALVEELERDYEYDGRQTCAVDGMCETACPVLIDTGDLIRRLRGRDAGPVAGRRLDVPPPATGPRSRRAAAAALTCRRRAARTPCRAPSSAGRGVLGADRSRSTTTDCRGAARRGPHCGRRGRSGPLRRLRRHDVRGRGDGDRVAAFWRCASGPGSPLRTPDALPGLCCGTPWKSKGHRDGYERDDGQVLPALAGHRGRPAAGGRRRLVLHRGPGHWPGRSAAELKVLDAIEFVAARVLPSLTWSRRSRPCVHPTCSSTELGPRPPWCRAAVAAEVVVPRVVGLLRLRRRPWPAAPGAHRRRHRARGRRGGRPRDVRGVRLGEPDLRDRDDPRDRPALPCTSSSCSRQGPERRAPPTRRSADLELPEGVPVVALHQKVADLRSLPEYCGCSARARLKWSQVTCACAAGGRVRGHCASPSSDPYRAPGGMVAGANSVGHTALPGHDGMRWGHPYPSAAAEGWPTWSRTLPD